MLGFQIIEPSDMKGFLAARLVRRHGTSYQVTLRVVLRIHQTCRDQNRNIAEETHISSFSFLRGGFIYIYVLFAKRRACLGPEGMN